MVCPFHSKDTINYNEGQLHKLWKDRLVGILRAFDGFFAIGGITVISDDFC